MDGFTFHLTSSIMVTPNTEIGYNSKIEGDVVVSTVDAVINWIRANSMWPMPMGLACCAIELMATAAARKKPLRSAKAASPRRR